MEQFHSIYSIIPLFLFFYIFFKICVDKRSIIWYNIINKRTEDKEKNIRGKEGTDHQKHNELPKTILKETRYRPPKY